MTTIFINSVERESEKAILLNVNVSIIQCKHTKASKHLVSKKCY